jgi:hypothetical protein
MLWTLSAAVMLTLLLKMSSQLADAAEPGGRMQPFHELPMRHQML